MSYLTDSDSSSSSPAPPEIEDDFFWEEDVIETMVINDSHPGFNELSIKKQWDWVEKIWSCYDYIGDYPQEPVEGIKINHRVKETKDLRVTTPFTFLYGSPDCEKILVCGCNKFYTFNRKIAGKEYLKPCLLKLDNGKYTLGYEYKGDYYFFKATLNENPSKYMDGTKNPRPSITIETLNDIDKGYMIRLMLCEPRIYLISDNQFLLVEFNWGDGYPTAFPFLF